MWASGPLAFGRPDTRVDGLEVLDELRVPLSPAALSDELAGLNGPTSDRAACAVPATNWKSPSHRS